MKPRTALISVYNKQGIAEFARELVDLNFKILASGGTAKVFVDAGLEVADVAQLVGGGAILGHRVVTLSREVHAGLLARDVKEDRDELAKLNIPWIDLVCVDLYPLEEEIESVKREALSVKEGYDRVVEKTDIGGPAMLRSAAKGGRIVVCEPADRSKTISWLKNGEPDKTQFLNHLAAKAEAVAANYALASARYLSAGKYEGIVLSRVLPAKYGENGYQKPAGLYEGVGADGLGLAKFKLVSGDAPSYNNWCDADRLLRTVTHIAAGFDQNYNQVPKIAVGVKHGNPCGAAVAEDGPEAVQKMLEGDLRAIFGGVVMVNFAVDEKLAEVFLSHRMGQNQRRLLDGIAAPSFTGGAIEMMKRKGDKCRFLVNPALSALSKNSLDAGVRLRYVRDGFLVQPNYTFILDFKNNFLEKTGSADDSQEKDMLLAWAVGSTSNSNTVTIVKDRRLIGNGVGQQDRVSCCQLAIKRAADAGHNISGAVAYSDSFFPFVDGPQVLAEAGIKNIFATSGSVRDEEVKKFCKEKGVSLYLVPDREARGFFGH